MDCRFAFFLVACVLACGPVAAKDRLPAIFVPEPEREGAPPMQGETWIGEGDGWAIWLKKLDDEDRAAYLEAQSGVVVDPFASPPDEERGYLTFVLVVENRGEAVLGLNPMGCWVHAVRPLKVLQPLLMTDLRFAYRVAGRQMPPAYEKIGELMLEDPQTVEPGNRISGLLVYRPLDPKTKRFDLRVALTLPDGYGAELQAPYRRLTNKELVELGLIEEK